MKIYSSNYYQQNFGMAYIINPKTAKAINSRLRNTEEIARLNELISRQAKNDKLNIEVLSDLNDNLSARITSNIPGGLEASYEEGLMASKFVSPIRFLERLSNIVNKQSKYITTDANKI